MNELASLLDPSKIIGERGGVFLTDVELRDELKVSQKAWGNIYDFDLEEFERERPDFFENKLDDHFAVISRHKGFSKGDVYLEIGCGPAYVGEFLMKRFHVAFVGMDFNLRMLETLQSYFDKEGLTNYLLIHAEITTMPLRDSVVDFIYGGGVIEHFANTNRILAESRRVLKDGGVSFNTVPAFNLSWLPLRFYNNIPATPWLRPAFTYVHMNLLRNRVLERNYGYELSFTQKCLIELHRRAGFRQSSAGPLRFRPSPARLKSPLLRNLYYGLAGQPLLAPVYYVAARK